jgi:hypothetical protein
MLFGQGGAKYRIALLAEANTTTQIGQALELKAAIVCKQEIAHTTTRHRAWAVNISRP